MGVTLQEAYDEACRLLGDASVRSALLLRELERTEQERDEAGQRIIALTQPAEQGEHP